MILTMTTEDKQACLRENEDLMTHCLFFGVPLVWQYTLCTPLYLIVPVFSIIVVPKSILLYCPSTPDHLPYPILQPP
jgi:hypothetical protein